MNLEELEAKLSDPLWRLCSGELYKIAPIGGGLQPFRPRPEQVRIIEAIYKEGVKQILIPKARRLGMSTVLGLICADHLLWRKEWQGSLVDRNANDATRKLITIVRLALENLPDWLRRRLRFIKNNDSQISIATKGSGVSSFYAGLNARGGTNHLLWVSEWGVIQYDDPKRSAEIRSGGLPSAEHGVKIIETTWQGGRAGDVWELLEPSLSGRVKDWLVLFSPWWVDPRKVDPKGTMDREAEQYFAKIAPRLQRDGITLSDEQRKWWAGERRAQGIFMARENPTFLDECWTSPVQGSVYAAAIDRARAEGRVNPFPIDGSNLVHTFWDLGAPSNTVVWYAQIVGREIRIIDVDRVSLHQDEAMESGFKGTITERVAMMMRKPYNYGKHYFPHDCEQTERTGATLINEVRKAGLQNAVTVPRTADVWYGINHALELFPALAFRSPQCDEALEVLAIYRTKRVGEGALSTDEPVHDWASHTADAFRTMAEAHRAGLIQFKHTSAEVQSDWYFPKQKRRGCKPMRVS